MLHAFLNLNKPAGITAHDCVARVRKLLHQKRVGHSGTLDPAATGVLPIALGQATRLLRFLPSGKGYIATVKFGITTNTDDAEGETIRSQPCSDLTTDKIEALLPLFRGKIQQTPPAFSAIQVGGVRLYDLAREGKAVEVPPRIVEVREINVLAWRGGDFPELDLAIDCSPGTYIRAIARDLGAQLGCGATLAALNRTHSNGFTLSSSLTLEEVDRAIARDSLTLTDPDVALKHLDEIRLAPELAKRWCCGQAISLEREALESGNVKSPDNSQPTNYQCVYDSKGIFLGVGETQDERIQPVVVLSPLSI